MSAQPTSLPSGHKRYGLGERVAEPDAPLISEESLGSLYSLMLSSDQHAIDMRASSPFPGVLTQKERNAALRAFETGWAA